MTLWFGRHVWFVQIILVKENRPRQLLNCHRYIPGRAFLSPFHKSRSVFPESLVVVKNRINKWRLEHLEQRCLLSSDPSAVVRHCC